MQKGKHFYLGANTPDGFFSYYDNLIDLEDAKRVYCIKGGPGSGKSTFMKRIASYMEKEGLFTEYIHCSSDDNSLDAILIKDKKIAFIDGTSPHITDPKYPGAVDEIINLGVFWNNDQIKKHRQDIIKTSTTISDSFDRAYDYLGALKKFYINNEKIYKRSCNRYLQNSFIDDILFEELSELPLTDYIGKKRKLFASAITPSGFKNRLDTIFKDLKVYTLSGYIDDLLIRLSDFIIERGIDVEMYFCPISPKTKCEHLVVPDLNLGFTLKNEYHSFEGNEAVDLSIESYLSHLQKGYIEFNSKCIKEIFDATLKELEVAKKNHDILEEFYAKNMDFESASQLADKTAKEILEKS